MLKLLVRNKIFMLFFDLRVGGLGFEVDCLEEFVEEFEVVFCCLFLEVGFVLDFLV